jgi:hypothetical protein
MEAVHERHRKIHTIVEAIGKHIDHEFNPDHLDQLIMGHAHLVHGAAEDAVCSRHTIYDADTTLLVAFYLALGVVAVVRGNLINIVDSSCRYSSTVDTQLIAAPMLDCPEIKGSFVCHKPTCLVVLDDAECPASIRWFPATDECRGQTACCLCHVNTLEADFYYQYVVPMMSVSTISITLVRPRHKNEFFETVATLLKDAVSID